jgi:general secretion pathway protein J
MLISVRQRPARPGFSSGFTLIEVVVALGVLSLILLATVSALRTFANTQVSLDRMIDRVDEVRTLSSFVRDTLGSAISGSSPGGGLSFGGRGGEAGYFESTPTSLSWKATALFGEAYGGTLLMRIAKEEGALKLFWQEPVPPNAPVVWLNANSRVLLDELEEFNVSFRSEFDLGWVTTQWEGEEEDKGAPALVRLRIKASGRYWPDLIVRVQR